MLEINNMQLRFGARLVLADCHLRVAAGERVGLIGASGAGKSSLLRVVAGVLPASGGMCNNTFGHPVLMFQEPRLLPWRTVRANLEIPLRARGVGKNEARQKTDAWLERVGLAPYAQDFPHQISGGMAQRAALARAFALEPDLLLLDEPFSALDAGLRTDLALLCFQCLQQTGAALLYVSHQTQEMGVLAQRCMRLAQGRLHTHCLSNVSPNQRAL